MTNETANAIALAAAIGSPLTAAVVYLIKWVRDLVDRERTVLLARALEAEKQLDEVQDAIRDLEAKRLADSREFGEAAMSQSHRIVQAIRALTSWTRKR